MRNLTIKLISLVLLMLSFISCKEDAGNIKIAFLLPNLKISRFISEKECFLKEAKKLGFEGIVIDAGDNEALQMKQVDELINNGVKVLIIAAINSNTGGVMVRKAKESGVITISYDGLITNAPLDYLLTFDNKKVGKLMAEYVIEKKPKGNFIIISGDHTNLNARQIKQGQDEVLEPLIEKGDVKIIYSEYTELWSEIEAKHIIKQYLQLTGNDRPDAVLCANDYIAQGIIEAFENEGIELPLITGQDASPIGCRNILNGKQAITIYKPAKDMGAMAANVAYLAAFGKNIEINTTSWNGSNEIPTILLNVKSVGKQNINETVFADNYLNKNDLIQ